MIHKIVNHCVSLFGSEPERTSDLLNDPSLVFARMCKEDSIEPRHIKSFIGKLSRQDTSNCSVSEICQSFGSLLLGTSLGSKNLTVARHSTSNIFKMLNAARQDQYRISSLDLLVSEASNLNIAFLVVDQLVQHGHPVVRPSDHCSEIRIDRNNLQIHRR